MGAGRAPLPFGASGSGKKKEEIATVGQRLLEYGQEEREVRG